MTKTDEEIGRYARGMVETIAALTLSTEMPVDSPTGLADRLMDCLILQAREIVQ